MPTLLCHSNDIVDGGARGFDPTAAGRDTVFVVRQGEALFGWHDQCPHEGVTPLPYKRHGYLNKSGSRIVCFAHGAQFDIRTGLCLTGPCKGDSLTPLALFVDGQGQVHCSAGKLAHSLEEKPSRATPECEKRSFSVDSEAAKNECASSSVCL
jgi:nitrite reductase/ring-hydroxylating ferredoxin subunit